MRKDLLTFGLGFVGGMTILYLLGKNRFTWQDLSKKQDQAEPQKTEEVDVPMTLSADASASPGVPSWAKPIFNRTWIVK